MARKKEVETPSLALMIGKLNAEFPDLITKASAPSRVQKIPTGVFQVDYILEGGLPLNRLNLLLGQKASFKTTLALKAVDNFLRTHDGEVVYIDTEHALDTNLIQRMGLDASRINIFPSQYGEQACEYAEKFAVLPEVGCIVIDSLAALNGKDEIEKGYFDAISRGVRARLIARMTRALVSLIDTKQKRLVIMINHLLPFVDGKTQGEYAPGGKTPVYFSSVVLKLWTTGKSENRLKFEDLEIENPFLQEKNIGFLVEHSKVSRDNVSGEFSLYLGEDEDDGIKYGDTNDCSLVLDYFQMLNMVEKSPPFVLHDMKFSSRIGIFRHWRKSPNLYEKVKADLITRILEQKTRRSG